MTRIPVLTDTARRRIGRAVRAIEGLPKAASGGSGRGGAAQSGLVRLWNRTGTQLEPGQIVALGDPIAPPDTELAAFRDLVGLEARVPEAADAGNFAIVPAPIPDDALGSGILSGVHLTKVDIQDAADEYADVTDSEVDYLTSAGAGAARILARETGTGVKWAYVLLGRAQSIAAACEVDLGGSANLTADTAWRLDFDHEIGTYGSGIAAAFLSENKFVINRTGIYSVYAGVTLAQYQSGTPIVTLKCFRNAVAADTIQSVYVATSRVFVAAQNLVRVQVADLPNYTVYWELYPTGAAVDFKAGNCLCQRIGD